MAIAFGKESGLVMRKGKVVARLKERELLDRFMQEVLDVVKEYDGE